MDEQIRNIWAVGRNYADHARELGNAVPAKTQEPIIFLKAGSSLLPRSESPGIFHLPSFSAQPAYEVEIVFQFGPRSDNVGARGDIEKLKLTGLTIGIDLTLRDVQNKLKAQAHPWTLAKSFREAALIGRIVDIPTSLNFNLQNIDFQLKVNGEVRQKGNTGDMINGVVELENYVLERFPVVPGDLLFTGTPAGVGEIHPGDLLEAEISGLLKASWRAAG